LLGLGLDTISPGILAGLHRVLRQSCGGRKSGCHLGNSQRRVGTKMTVMPTPRQNPGLLWRFRPGRFLLQISSIRTTISSPANSGGGLHLRRVVTGLSPCLSTTT